MLGQTFIIMLKNFDIIIATNIYGNRIGKTASEVLTNAAWMTNLERPHKNFVRLDIQKVWLVDIVNHQYYINSTNLPVLPPQKSV